MDIEEIKKELGTRTAGSPVTNSLAVPDALLWIIERLQETPNIEVARLEPGDVVVLTVPKMISNVEHDRLKERATMGFPGHEVLVLDAGITLSAMGGKEL